MCVLPWLCPPSNDTIANVTVGLNGSAADNASIADPSFETFAPFASDESDGGDVTVTEVVTVAGGDGDAVETIIVEETEYITLPEETETVTVAIETVTVDAEGEASASAGSQ